MCQLLYILTEMRNEINIEINYTKQRSKYKSLFYFGQCVARILS